MVEVFPPLKKIIFFKYVRRGVFFFPEGAVAPSLFFRKEIKIVTEWTFLIVVEKNGSD